MDIESVKLIEAANDGRTIHLFYDEMVGVYMGFGLSAYYLTMIVEPYLSFSDAMNMPVALLNRNGIGYLRQSVVKLEHQPKSYYRFRINSKVGDAGYDRWLKEKFGDKV